jgi:hypothetical protein
MDVESLKLLFGQMAFRMHKNMDEYQELHEQYTNDNVIGLRIAALKKK